MKVLPYVYRCTHKTTNEFYIGFRCRNKLPANQDIQIYQTSSKRVKFYFNEFNVEILAEFFDKIDAYDFEQQLIWEEWKNPLILNKSCFYNGARFSTMGSKHSDNTRKKISLSKIGKNITDETKQKIRQARLKNKDRYLNVNRNRVYFVSDETKLKISESKKGKNYQTPEHKERLRQINSSKRWYTNGIINIKSVEPLDGFVLGRTIKRDGSIPS